MGLQDMKEEPHLGGRAKKDPTKEGEEGTIRNTEVPHGLLRLTAVQKGFELPVPREEKRFMPLPETSENCGARNILISKEGLRRRPGAEDTTISSHYKKRISVTPAGGYDDLSPNRVGGARTFLRVGSRKERKRKEK